MLCCRLSVEAADIGASAYQQAAARYQGLKRQDPQITDLSEWESAAAAIEDFVEGTPKSSETAQALFDLGMLYRQMYERRQFRLGLTKAIFNFERLARDFRGHPLVDDGLLALGDLRRSGLRDEVAARAAYYEILDVYGSGDRADEARGRLGLKAEKRAFSSAAKGRGDPALPTGQGQAVSQAARSSISISQSSSSSEPDAEAPLPSTSDNGSFFSLFRGKSGSRQVYTAQKAVERPIVCIDPGHGGEESGAKGVEEGVLEKDIVLNIALYLDKLLRERLRAEVILTRNRDVGVPLEERIAIANQHNADLFVSIHLNATPLHNATGVETYYLDNTQDQSSLRLAERENISLGKPIGDVDFIISDLIQNAKMDESISLAHYLQNSLHSSLSRYYTGVRNLGVKKAPFYVLVGAHMPCVLVEVSFVDHPIEGRRLMQPRYQKLVSKALFLGMRDFFEHR